jgi:hypothetical protein
MESIELVEPPVKVESAEAVFERVYEPGFLQVARFVSKNGGTFEDAKDIFHDALVVFYEQRDNGAIESEVNYITGIAKHLWWKKFKGEIRNSSLDESFYLTCDQNPSVNEKKLVHLLKITGKRCMDLLSAFYSNKPSLSGIAKRFNLSGEHSVSAQKYKCIEKLRSFIKTKSMSYEDFLE